MSGVRRRTKRSVSISEAKFKAEENVTEPNKGTENNRVIKELPHYGKKICHETRDSLFSSKSGFSDYRGFLNLCVILLAISNARLFLENVLKYGILVDPFQWMSAVFQDPYQWPNVLLMCISNVFIIIAYYIEVAVAQSKISNKVGIAFHTLNLLAVVCLPPLQILMLEPHPIGSVFACGMYIMVFVKLWSYAQANSWYREDYLKTSGQKRRLRRTASMPDTRLEKQDPEDIKVQYPYNLTLKNLYYFICAPTLCYELNYPRNKKIRRAFLLRRIVEVLFLLQLELALCQQWIVPTLQKAIAPIHKLEGSRMLERLLRLAIPNHFMWLIFFYWFFHSVLNVIAEILRFADREFYRDWWNSETIVYFWQAWNIPVHKWCTRHLYKPILRSGGSKFMAQVAVFLLSAFFHEYMVSIPLHVFPFWAFMGMIAQIPLSGVTYWVSTRYSGHYGNMMVWFSLIVGQPMAILAYVYQYYVLQYGEVAAGTNPTQEIGS